MGNDKEFYAVSVGGRQAYLILCHKQTNRFSNECYEGFHKLEDAIRFMTAHGFQKGDICVFDQEGEEHSLQSYIDDNIYHSNIVALPPLCHGWV